MRVLFLLFALVAGAITAGTAAQAEDISIGFIRTYPDSLGAAESQQMDDSLKARLSQINNGGGLLGKQLKLIPQDSQNKPDRAVAVAIDLVQRENAKFILVHGNQVTAVPVSTRLQEPRLSHVVVLIGSPQPADQATALLEAWVERVKSAGTFDLSGDAR